LKAIVGREHDSGYGSCSVSPCGRSLPIFDWSAFFALLVVAQPVPAADSYVHVELGVLEQAQGAIVRGFNILGEAVGGSVGFGQGKRAFLVREGSAENIDALLGGDSSLAHAINEQSTVLALQIPPVHFARFSGAEPAESESSALCQATVAVRHSALTDIMK
jgi:hypothetical protein